MMPKFSLDDHFFTKVPDQYKSDSSKNQGIIIKLYHDTDQDITNIDETNKTKVTTTFSTKKFFYSKLWEEVYSSHAINQQEQIDRLVPRLQQKIIAALRRFDSNGEELSSAERLIIDISEQYSFRILGEVIQRIYIAYNDSPDILIGICRGLERFDCDEVTPWGPIMLTGLLTHKNESVKEAAVTLVENWATVSLLPILRNVEIRTEWMQAYVDSVVRFLESCDSDCII